MQSHSYVPRIAALLLLLSIGFLIAAPASAFVLTRKDGIPVRWTRPVVEYWIHPFGYPLDDDYAAIHGAFDVWEAAMGDSGPDFQYAGINDNSLFDRFDGKHTIYFGVDFDGFPVGGAKFGLTTLEYCEEAKVEVNGQIFIEIDQFDILFEQENDSSLPGSGCWKWGTSAEAADVLCPTLINGCVIGTPRADLFSVAVHEIGHVIGLDHTDDPFATMHERGYPAALCDASFGTLYLDDIDGARAIYPDCEAESNQPLVLFSPVSADSDTNCVQVEELHLSSGPHFVGSQLNGSFEVRNVSMCPFTIDALAITGRHLDGTIWDFPMHGPLTFAPGEFYSYSEPFTFHQPGWHTFEVSYLKAGEWFRTAQLNQTGIGIQLPKAVVSSPLQPFIVGARNEFEVVILPGLGDGTFQAEESIDVLPDALRSVAAADFDQDGLLDIAAVAQNTNCYLLMNQGAIQFQRSFLHGFGASLSVGAATVGDFSSDGYPDLVVFTGKGASEVIHVLVNPAFGVDLRDVVVPGAPSDNDFKPVEAADVNEDGHLDLVVDYYQNTNGTRVHWFEGDGAGGFVRHVAHNTFPNSGGAPGMGVGDFNDDGHVDLVVGFDDDGDPGQAWLSHGDGLGNFGSWIHSIDVNPTHESGGDRPGTGDALAYDFNRDGRDDIYAAAGTLGGKLWLRTGPDTFANPVVVSAPTIRSFTGAPSRQAVAAATEGFRVPMVLGPEAYLVFDSVIQAGSVQLQRLNPAEGPFGVDATVALIEIVSSLVFEGAVSLTLDVAALAGAQIDVSRVALYHLLPGSGWHDITTLVDPTSSLIHGQTTGFSRFAIVQEATGTPEVPESPARSLRLSCHPNPFNPRTELAFEIPGAGLAELEILDLRGRRVRRLVSRHHSAGVHRQIWDGCDDDGGVVAAGVYFAQLRFGSLTRSQKVVLLK